MRYNIRRIKILILFLFVLLPGSTELFGAVIKGHVFLRDGKTPAPQIRIGLAYYPGIQVKSQADGTFQIDNVEAGQQIVICKPDGYRPARQTVNVEESDTVNVKLVLRPMSEVKTVPGTKPTLEVILLTGPRAIITPGSSVQLVGPVKRSVQTSKTGRAVFENLPAGTYEIHAKDTKGKKGKKEITLPPGGIVHQSILRIIPD